MLGLRGEDPDDLKPLLCFPSLKTHSNTGYTEQSVCPVICWEAPSKGCWAFSHFSCYTWC